MSMFEGLIERVTDTVVVEAEKTRAELQTAFTDSLRGRPISGALSRPFRANAANYSAGGRLIGWSLRAAGGDVTVTFHDGHGTDDDVVATLVLPAGTSNTIGLPGDGVSFVRALWVEVTGAGAAGVVGGVWIGTGA